MTRLMPIVFTVISTSCFTPVKEKKINDQLFDLQTRLMDVERNTTAKGKALSNSTAVASQQIASTATLLDRIDRELQKVNGDIDSLKVGVQTGQMPTASPDDPSVAVSIQNILARVDTIEKQQNEILEAINKAKSQPSRSKKDKLTSLKNARIAFKNKKYSLIAASLQALLKKNKRKSTRLELYYILAESNFKLGKLRDAALNFNEFLETGAKGELVPFAKMRLGDCFRLLGETATARLYYEEVVKDFPTSSEAKTSKKRLASLKKRSANTRTRPGTGRNRG
jgi:TolA-binding protein